MANISQIQLPSGVSYPLKAPTIPYGTVDSTSTATVYTATVSGITELTDGTVMMLHNGVVTSASGFTINVNGLGAKKVYNNLTNVTQDTTIFNVAYTMLFVYSSALDGGNGGWWCYRGYDSNTNTVGYQLRVNNSVRNVSDTARYYKIYFTSADNTKWVPASVDSTNNATAARPVNQRPIDPFGPIVYTSANTNYTAGSNLAATSAWQQYNFALGYSFNRTGAALTLTAEAPVYVKCAPQANGSAIMDSTTPYVQALPTTNDGKIYMYLGLATSATNIELVMTHPVYYHDGTGIRLWTGKTIPTKTSELTNDSGYITSSSLPTKTSDLTNDGDGASVFATMADIGGLGGGTITGVKTTAGAHTTIDVSSGAAQFNVPTNTSHLTNDSGFVTTDSDEKVKYVPVQGTDTNAYGLLYAQNNGGSEQTSSVYTGRMRFQPSTGTLSIFNSTGSRVGTLTPFQLSLKHSNSAYGGNLVIANLTGGRTYTLPDATGTIALTSNIPSKTSELTNDSGFITNVTLDGTSVVSSGVAALTSATLTASDDGNGNVTLGLTGIGALSTASGVSF